MKKQIKLLTLLGLLLVSGASLASCTTPGPSVDASGNTIVKMSIMNSENENPGWLAMIDAANQVLEAQGEKVRIEADIINTDSWDTYYTKITSNMIGHMGGTIGRIAESHVPGLIQKNQAADLTDLRNLFVEVRDDNGELAYNANAFEGVAKVDGKYYGLPSGTQHMVLYYNKTVIDKYNKDNPNDQISYPSGDWNNPSTYEEIQTMARKLSVGPENARTRFGASIAPFLSYAGMYATNSGGENIFNDAGECIIKSQPYYDVYKWFDDMLKVDKSMPSTSDTQLTSAFERFLQGNVAMMVDGVWQLHDIIEYTEFEVGVAAIPVKTSGTTASTTTFADRFWAARNSSTPEADKIALKALMSAESLLAVSSKQVGGLPVRYDAIDNYFASLSESKLADYVEVIKEGVNHSLTVPYSTYYNIVDQRINQKMSTWINGELTHIEFVDYMDEVMKKGMAGQL